MVNKLFDARLHYENDFITRQKIMIYFNNLGKKLTNNPDIYGIDLLEYDNGVVVAGYEIERRDNWEDGEFPFSTVHIPLRKIKFVCNSYATYSITVNKKLTKALMINLWDVISDKPVEVRNCYVSDGEEFLNIELSRFEVIDLSQVK